MINKVSFGAIKANKIMAGEKYSLDKNCWVDTEGDEFKALEARVYDNGDCYISLRKKGEEHPRPPITCKKNDVLPYKKVKKKK